MSSLTMQATTTAVPPTGVAVCFRLLIRNSADVWTDSVQPAETSRDYVVRSRYNIMDVRCLRVLVNYWK